jgi:hypothetical protein
VLGPTACHPDENRSRQLELSERSGGDRKGTHESLEMLHKNLQRDVIGEDRGRSARSAVRASAHVRRRRIQLGEKESSLGSALVADDVSRDRVSVGEQVLDREAERKRGRKG